ncbi:aldo/keto reductase [Microbacterium sp. 18062]|uniref:aldo/keto reductase n=1 Tax=Microbacterium sp. 18062 TaxID=2681410 RepID=UPI0013578A08|nr:aldo/keto reductase [Microbacterium sp. 18062]
MSDAALPDFLPSRCAGRSGLMLPPLSLGLWQNFGRTRSFESQRELILAAFEAGVWHFDNANRYGPPHGWAEEVLGRVISEDLAAYRNLLVVSTKAGNPIMNGPYGRGGSRKHLLESLDDSLKRLNLDHVDIFYSHSPDKDVPLEETVAALAHTVTSGKALYVGISNYGAEATAEVARLLASLGVPLVLHQHKYSLLHRDPETNGVHRTLRENSISGIVYSPLAQGLLTDRYLTGRVPSGARAESSVFLTADFLTQEYLAYVQALADVAAERSQTVAQLALQWVMRDPTIASAIIGVSSVAQLHANLAALNSPPLDDETVTRLKGLSLQGRLGH